MRDCSWAELQRSCGNVRADTATRAAARHSVVPGGTFYRSYDNVTYTDKGYPATVSDFRLDLYEVTVGRFRKFVAGYPGNMPAAGAGKNPNNPSDPGWDAAWNAVSDAGSPVMPADHAALVSAIKCDR